MQRRKVLQYLPVAFVISASPGQLLDIAARARETGFFPRSAREKLIVALADSILPATSTPSASEAGVPAFIRLALEELASPLEREGFYTALDQFSGHCRTQYGSAFEDMSTSAQITHLTGLFEQHDDFCMQMKSLTMTAYFTSQRGMTETLDYNPIPGAYHPCVQVTDGTKTEASYF